MGESPQVILGPIDYSFGLCSSSLGEIVAALNTPVQERFVLTRNVYLAVTLNDRETTTSEVVRCQNGPKASTKSVTSRRQDFNLQKMNSLVFRPLWAVYTLIRVALAIPIFIFGIVVPAIKRRYTFERRNRFMKTRERPVAAFEFASEGEFEQVRPLAEGLLEKGLCIELMFSSNSVEKGVERFSKKFPEQIRYIRLPLILGPMAWRFQPHYWSKAPHWVFCRYDFYPELILPLLWGQKTADLMSAKAFKKHQFIMKGLFQTIIPADKGEEARLRDQNLPLTTEIRPWADMRAIQIKKRLSLWAENKGHFPWSKWESNLKSHHPYIENRFLLAQWWPHEEELIEGLSEDFCRKVKSGEILLALTPHRLNKEWLKSLRDILTQKFGGFELIEQGDLTADKQREGIESLFTKTGKPLILFFSGHLCELYSWFGRTYIGGGFGDGVHSVLEPALSQCEISYGPHHLKSLEVKSLTGIANLNTLGEQGALGKLWDEKVGTQSRSPEIFTLAAKAQEEKEKWINGLIT